VGASTHASHRSGFSAGKRAPAAKGRLLTAQWMGFGWWVRE